MQHDMMDVESVECECCGLKEDCTRDYIAEVRANFEGKWLCGLCAEAVGDEKKSCGVRDAVRAHMSFCSKSKASPAGKVADGMRQMLRRRSGDLAAPDKKFGAPASSSRVVGGDDDGFSNTCLN